MTCYLSFNFFLKKQTFTMQNLQINQEIQQ